MSLAADARAVAALVRRDLLRLLRDRARLGGALAQPLLFWLVIGSGLAPTFRVEAAPTLSYQQYFYPGVVLMVVLFGAIFSTIAVIEDRHQGMLQGVLVSAASRPAMALGRIAGAALVVLLQALSFLVLAPAAGFALGSVQWLPLLGALVLCAVALCALGFAVAWKLDSSAGYHAVMNVVLLPLWIVSGAMFPAPSRGVMHAVMLCNPMAHAASLARRALHGGALPPGTGLPEVSVALQWGALVAGTALALAMALRVVRAR